MELLHNFFVCLFPMLSDKSLHFFIMGFTGTILFLILKHYFMIDAMCSYAVCLFLVYTVSIMIEMDQLINHWGSFEINDVTYSVAGFLYFSLYPATKLIYYEESESLLNDE